MFKSKVFNFLKFLMIGCVGLYLALVICFFIYHSFLFGPYLAMQASNEVFGRGVVMRMLQLPVRDEVIEQLFRNNRSQFKEIVDLQEENCSSSQGGGESIRAEISAISKVIGVEDVSNDEAHFWRKDPYSSSAVLENRAINDYRLGRVKEIQKIMDERERSAEMVGLYKRIKESTCPLQAVSIVIEKSKNRAGHIKGIKYFPVAPRVDSAGIYFPDKYTNKVHSAVIKNDLNELSLGFFTGKKTCAYKKMEENWYIFVCE
jgi:hypothetical protein